ncbi:MAG: polysaccharide deacetylase family protein, partial [Candidatus Tyrphobacter sp.]
MDFEPDLYCPQGRVRLVEDERRLERLVGLLRGAQVPLTIFVAMKHAERFRGNLETLCKEIDAELAVHSYSHDTRQPASADEIARAVDAYGEIWNRKPAGYRAPNCLIDDAGIERLIGAGFAYDSSITPSLRIDRYGYNRLRYPREPFVFSTKAGSLVELPIACFGGVRLPLILSYVKMLGAGTYGAIGSIFPLPDVVTVYFHPYDLYAAEVAGNIRGWKRFAHLRNGRRGFELLAYVIDTLERRG